MSFSDHDAIITDINVNFDWDDDTIPDTVRAKYGQITAIPVKPRLAEESNDITDIEHDTKGKAEDELTETEQEQKKLLHTYRECFNHTAKNRTCKNRGKNQGYTRVTYFSCPAGQGLGKHFFAVFAARGPLRTEIQPLVNEVTSVLPPSYKSLR